MDDLVKALAEARQYEAECKADVEYLQAAIEKRFGSKLRELKSYLTIAAVDRGLAETQLKEAALDITTTLAKRRRTPPSGSASGQNSYTRRRTHCTTVAPATARRSSWTFVHLRSWRVRHGWRS